MRKPVWALPVAVIVMAVIGLGETPSGAQKKKQDPKLQYEVQVGEVVVGLPRRLGGGQGPQAEKVLVLVEGLRARLKVPVTTWDERFTTTIAEQALIEGDVSRRKRRDKVDQLAAVLILQSYLDYRKLAGPAAGAGA